MVNKKKKKIIEKFKNRIKIYFLLNLFLLMKNNKKNL